MSNCHVLVADDDDDLRTTLAEILRLEGYKVEVARNGLEAVLSATKHRPSVVLLDMRMPMVDGWEVARQLATYGVDSAILVMSAAVDTEAAARDIHAAGFFEKPFTIEELLPAINRLCD